ncbi:MAG: site-specific integrase [Syntrophorhabdales bacterium]|jgi:hypothetical protein
MKKGSIHFQIQQLFLKSGVFTPGVSKHEAKLRAREKGISSWKEMGEAHTIYSFETADAYLGVWHQLGRHAHLHGLNSIDDLTQEHVRAYLSSKIEEGVARSTYRLHTAAIMKFEKALRLRGMAVPSFRPVIGELAKAVRALKQDHLPRAYVDPPALIHAIAREPLRLIACLQYEGGARVREVSLIKEVQLLGEEEDGLTGAIMGKIHLIHCKGGLERDILVSLPTYGTLARAIRAGDPFKINAEVYRRAVVRAARESCQDYHGTHGLRWNFAQRRFISCRDHGLSEEQALKKVSREMGHRRARITLRYLLPTPY